MSEVQYCHEIDEFENAPMKDEIFSFDSQSMNVNEFRKVNKLGECHTFYPLTDEEMAKFAEYGINGDFLRRTEENVYVNTFFGISYTINQRGTISKTFKY